MNTQEDQIPASEKPIKITIILSTTAYFISGIRDFTFNLVKNVTGFSNQWAFRFQSIVDELCNNSIEHGSRPGEDIKITFISEKNKSLSVIVEDTGTGPKPKTAQEMYQAVEELKKNPWQIGIRGRGLAQIISKWTDKLDFEDLPTKGLKISIIKYLNPEENKQVSAPRINLGALDFNQPAYAAQPNNIGIGAPIATL